MHSPRWSRSRAPERRSACCHISTSHCCSRRWCATPPAHLRRTIALRTHAPVAVARLRQRRRFRQLEELIARRNAHRTTRWCSRASDDLDLSHGQAALLPGCLSCQCCRVMAAAPPHHCGRCGCHCRLARSLSKSDRGDCGSRSAPLLSTVMMTCVARALALTMGGSARLVGCRHSLQTAAQPCARHTRRVSCAGVHLCLQASRPASASRCKALCRRCLIAHNRCLCPRREARPRRPRAASSSRTSTSRR